MAGKITEQMLDNIFNRWVEEGIRVGAISKNPIYALEDGTSYTSFSITSLDARGCRTRLGTATVPHLGKTKASAYNILEAMVAAWRMVP